MQVESSESRDAELTGVLNSPAKVKLYQSLFLKEDLIGRDKASGVGRSFNSLKEHITLKLCYLLAYCLSRHSHWNISSEEQRCYLVHGCIPST